MPTLWRELPSSNTHKVGIEVVRRQPSLCDLHRSRHGPVMVPSCNDIERKQTEANGIEFRRISGFYRILT